MGLDQYLTKEYSIFGEFEHSNAVGSVNIKTKDLDVSLDATKVSSITEQIGYWRKANQIHKWFVDNIQEGVDECQRSYVPVEKLVELRDLCKEALTHKDSGKLPTASGFFFGSTEIDEYYWGDLEATVEILSGIDESKEQPYGISYYYQASW